MMSMITSSNIPFPPTHKYACPVAHHLVNGPHRAGGWRAIGLDLMPLVVGILKLERQELQHFLTGD